MNNQEWMAAGGLLAVGYLGGWLFKGEADLRERYGLIVAFLLVYFSFATQLWALLVVSSSQNWLFTGLYGSAFCYRFFMKHG